MDLQTWVSLFAIVASFGSLYVMLRRELGSFRAELKRDIAGLRSEVKEDIAGLRSEVKEDIADLRSEVKEDITDARSESRAASVSLADRMNRLDDRVYLLATGLRPYLEQAPQVGGSTA